MSGAGPALSAERSGAGAERSGLCGTLVAAFPYASLQSCLPRGLSNCSEVPIGGARRVAIVPAARRPHVAAVDLAPLIIANRFNGPPGSAHGGWAAGLLASRVLGSDVDCLGRAAQVTLRHPPPLGSRLQVSMESEGTTPDGCVVLTFGGAVIAQAVPVELDIAAVDPVSPLVASEAMARFAGLTNHPYPTCFACGVARPDRDGLGLRPGPLQDRAHTTATTWVPTASLAGVAPATASLAGTATATATAIAVDSDAADFGEDDRDADYDGDADESGRDTVPAAAVWAALDCPGGWAVEIPGRPLVLGRITAQVDALPLMGERCVVMGVLLGRDGRKVYTATTVYDGDGRALARAAATWIETSLAAS